METTFWQNKRVVVTGGAGFLGSHLVAALQKLSPKEIIVPRSSEFDLREKAVCAKVVAGADVGDRLAVVADQLTTEATAEQRGVRAVGDCVGGGGARVVGAAAERIARGVGGGADVPAGGAADREAGGLVGVAALLGSAGGLDGGAVGGAVRRGGLDLGVFDDGVDHLGVFRVGVVGFGVLAVVAGEREADHQQAAVQCDLVHGVSLRALWAPRRSVARLTRP